MSYSSTKVPLFDLRRQHLKLRTQIIDRWTKLIDQNQLTYGSETHTFEENFAKLCHTKYSLGVRSGTASLFISLLAAGIQPGDEVITTANTFSATADAIQLIGAVPVFTDTEPIYGTISPTEVISKITKKTKAVLCVHLYGVTCEIEQLVNICETNNIALIEDASHAHGTTYKGKPVGSFGLAGCFSLYPSKTLGCAGNAGIITSNDENFIMRAKMYAHHGIKDNESKYIHNLIGYNELIDNVQAAFLNTKLPHLENWITKKKEIAERYNAACQKVNLAPMGWPKHCQPSIYVYAIQVDERENFRKHMANFGIETGIYYPTPLHIQPSYKKLGYKLGDLPNTEKWMDKTVSLPLYPELKEEEIELIIQALLKIRS